MRRLWITLAFCLLAVPGFGCAAAAQADEDPVEAPAPATSSLPRISKADYLAQIAQMQALIGRCQANPDLCDVHAIPSDASVDNGSFDVHWLWLRDAIGSSRNAKSPDRTNLLQTASDRLADDAATAGAAQSPELNAAPAARAKANEILSRPEFRRVEQNSYLAEKIAAFYLWLDKVLGSVAGLRAPWIAPAIEIGLLVLASAGLLIWAWRMSQQQRLVVAEARSANAAAWEKESENWAERAAAEAARGEWREAVHCLYWSAIVLLEGQKAWRQNRARTPREYLQLLEAGSSKQQALGGLTRLFERIWYGLRPAAESDYLQAGRLLEQLRLG